MALVTWPSSFPGSSLYFWLRLVTCLLDSRDVIEVRGWKVIAQPVGSGIFKTPLVDRQNLTAKALLSHSIMEFNALNARLKG